MSMKWVMKLKYKSTKSWQIGKGNVSEREYWIYQSHRFNILPEASDWCSLETADIFFGFNLLRRRLILDRECPLTVLYLTQTFIFYQILMKFVQYTAREALEGRTWDCLNVTWAQKWHSDIFQISAEKSFRAWQKDSCTFLSNFGGCNLQKSCGKTSTFIQ